MRQSTKYRIVEKSKSFDWRDPRRAPGRSGSRPVPADGQCSEERIVSEGPSEPATEIRTVSEVAILVFSNKYIRELKDELGLPSQSDLPQKVHDALRESVLLKNTKSGSRTISLSLCFGSSPNCHVNVQSVRDAAVAFFLPWVLSLVSCCQVVSSQQTAQTRDGAVAFFLPWVLSLVKWSVRLIAYVLPRADVTSQRRELCTSQVSTLATPRERREFDER
jgi:hypothetical protein